MQNNFIQRIFYFLFTATARLVWPVADLLQNGKLLEQLFGQEWMLPELID